MSLSLFVWMIQRDTTGLTNENGDLKLQVQTMEQQVRLQDGKVFCGTTNSKLIQRYFVDAMLISVIWRHVLP